MENFTIRKIEKNEIDAAMAILGKWNMAPLEATKNIPNPERESLDLKHTFVALENNKIIGVYYPDIG